MLLQCTRQFVEFKIYISLKRASFLSCIVQCLQNSKFTYLSNSEYSKYHNPRFVEFKIYISLKHICSASFGYMGFVEFKIYISLKLNLLTEARCILFVEFKIYISLKLIQPLNSDRTCLQNSKFTYLSNCPNLQVSCSYVCRIQNLHISQTTVFSQFVPPEVCRIQNLHISQTI